MRAVMTPRPFARAALRSAHSNLRAGRSTQGIAGVNLGLMRNMYAYAEARVFDESVGIQGEEGFDALAISVHYGFSLKGFHRR